MKIDPKTKTGILLDRQFHGVLEEQNASFREEDMRLFALERDLLEQVLNRNAMRKANGEKNCSLDPIGNGVGTIGGFEFWFNSVTNNLVHEDEQFTIQLAPDTFLSDAEEIMAGIYEQRDLLQRIAPTTIRIGIVPNKSSALAGCIPATGDIAIYSDRNGGLLVTGFAELTKDDDIPISSRQVVVHEFTHALERNATVRENLKPLIEYLVRFAKDGFPSESETGKSLGEYAARIAPGYLPARLKRWVNSRNEAVESAASNMASEFWAELCTAAQVGEELPFSHVSAPIASLEQLRTFISSDYSTLVSGPLAKRGDESKHRDVVKSLPGPDPSSIHIEYAGDRLAYKVEFPDRSGR